MPLMSGGQLVLSDATRSMLPTTYHPADGLNLSSLFASYGNIYKRQRWVYAVVRKRALATRRLPLKTYRRTSVGREDARDTPLAQLLRQPNVRHSGSFLWEWTSSTFDTYGEAIWLKVRGRDGRPIELWPVHPSNVVVRFEGNRLEYLYGAGVISGAQAQFVIPERDVVHFRSYNPDSTVRGLSPLEPLRMTLINEDAASRASAAFWTNGGRPAGYLSHPKTLNAASMERLRAQWNEIHQGVDNFGKWAILEEGMEPKVLSLSAEESQYIESRKLNREEVCGVYDIPPPVVHILDHATYSNITEQMRSMYRDTMAPHLGGFEATLMFQLVNEFNDELYCEFLMDEVLRGDFEVRVAAAAQAINTGQLTPAEWRVMENRPFIEGSDKLFINSAVVPIELAGTVPSKTQNDSPRSLALSTAMGRLGRVTALDDIDPLALTAGMNGEAAIVLDLLDASKTAHHTIEEFRAIVRAALA
jgi:HK97 family phage portal protein